MLNTTLTRTTHTLQTLFTRTLHPRTSLHQSNLRNNLRTLIGLYLSTLSRNRRLNRHTSHRHNIRNRRNHRNRYNRLGHRQQRHNRRLPHRQGNRMSRTRTTRTGRHHNKGTSTSPRIRQRIKMIPPSNTGRLLRSRKNRPLCTTHTHNTN